MDQIIHSLLETDMYKLSMGQAIYHHFSDYKTTWRFADRSNCIVVCISLKTNWHTLTILNG